MVTDKWILAIESIIVMLQNTDTERLRNKLYSKRDQWISLRRKNKIYFGSGLGIGGNGNRSDQVWGYGGRE